MILSHLNRDSIDAGCHVILPRAAVAGPGQRRCVDRLPDEMRLDGSASGLGEEQSRRCQDPSRFGRLSQRPRRQRVDSAVDGRVGQSFADALSSPTSRLLHSRCPRCSRMARSPSGLSSTRFVLAIFSLQNPFSNYLRINFVCV